MENYMVDNNNNQNNNQNQAPVDLGQLLKVRREKLANLQEAGKDPFVITKFDQTHHSDASTAYTRFGRP